MQWTPRVKALLEKEGIPKAHRFKTISFSLHKKYQK